MGALRFPGLAALGDFDHMDHAIPGAGRVTLHFRDGCAAVVSNGAGGVLEAIWPPSEMTTNTPPLPHPVVLDDQGYAWLPSPDEPGEHSGSYLYHGFRLAWAPMTIAEGVPGILLYLVGGLQSDRDFLTDAVAVSVTRPGLRALIADLQAMDAALEPAP